MKNKTRSVFAYLVILVATAIRSFQLLNTVDPVTGNVINAYIPLQRFFNISLLVCLVAVAVISFFSKPRYECFEKPSKAMAVASALVACSLMFDAFKILFEVFKNVSSSSTLELVLFALSVIAALYFVSLSVSMVSKKQLFPNPLLPAFVILCFALKLITQYMHSVQNANISEHKFTILMYAAFTLFWVFYARFSNRSKKSKRFVSFFSFMAVFCAVTVLVPRLIAYLVPRIFPAYFTAPSAVFNTNALFAADVATVIFAVVFIYYINREEKVEEDNEDDFLLEGIKGVSNESSTEQMMQNVMGAPQNENPTLLTADSVQSLIDEVLPEITEQEIAAVTFEEEIADAPELFKVTISDEQPAFEQEVTEPEAEPAAEEALEVEVETEPEAEEPVIEEPVIEEPVEDVVEEIEQEENTEIIEDIKEQPVVITAEEEITNEAEEVEQPEISIEQPTEKVVIPDEAEEDASADDIINNLLDEIMGKYGEDN